MARSYTPPPIQWADIPIEVITDEDGNYEGVLIERIDMLLARSDPKAEVVYTITEFSEPISEATLNENNDIHIVVKEMNARSSQNVSLSVSATTKTAHAKKRFSINFWRPSSDIPATDFPTTAAPRVQDKVS